MKSRPMLFSTPMVQAILNGSKTQTRRIVNPQPIENERFCGGAYIPTPKKLLRPPEVSAEISVEASYVHTCCPYGRPGDQLWVRETWADLSKAIGRTWEKYNPETKLYDRGFTPFVWYRADGEQPDNGSGTPFSEPWRPSIHMPRSVCRLNLKITRIRVERLQDISVKDAIAEGIPRGGPENPDGIEIKDYRNLWEQINGAGSWDKNPWVWVVEFKRV